MPTHKPPLVLGLHGASTAYTAAAEDQSRGTDELMALATILALTGIAFAELAVLAMMATSGLYAAGCHGANFSTPPAWKP